MLEKTPLGGTRCDDITTLCSSVRSRGRWKKRRYTHARECRARARDCKMSERGSRGARERRVAADEKRHAQPAHPSRCLSFTVVFVHRMLALVIRCYGCPVTTCFAKRSRACRIARVSTRRSFTSWEEVLLPGRRSPSTHQSRPSSNPSPLMAHDL